MVPATVETLSTFTGSVLRTILVVEDEAIIRACATEFLRECGYRVIEAGDAAEAKDLLLTWHVDLVFSDVNMPNRETGFALEKWIRRSYPGVKVLLTSGSPQAVEDTRGLSHPMIAKPYSYSRLLRTIDALFDPGESLYR